MKKIMADKKIYSTHSEFNLNVLDVIIDIMKRKGAPVIRVVDCGEYYQALEGTHRLAACHILGIQPKLVVYDYEENKMVVIEINGKKKRIKISEACDYFNCGKRSMFKRNFWKEK